MKLLLASITLISSFCLPTFASDADGSPSARSASKLALDHAMDNVFMDILDHDSHLVITPIGEDESVYSFRVIADERCLVVVSVSKETGLAFNDQDMTCKD